MEKRVEYNGEGFGKKFNITHNLYKFWGVSSDELIGLELVDRLNPNHTAKILDYDFKCGTATVTWENGGWTCLDHAIEQFDVLKKQIDNPTLEQIAIEQDNEKSYREDVRQEYREEERRNRREAEIENERPSWNIN